MIPHVLVTRPAPQGEILCEKIRAAGGVPLYLPTLVIQSLPVPPPDFSTFDWLIFVSPQAVTQALRWKSFGDVNIAAIGAGTAEALRAAGFTVQACPSQDWRSEGLLALPAFQAIEQKKIAIVKGVGGRELLAETLRARGAQVTVLDIYERVLPHLDVAPYLDVLRKHGIDVVICTSNTGLLNLKVLLQAEWGILQNIPVIVVSERMVNYAQLMGFKKVLRVENASHETLLRTLSGRK